MAGEAITIYRSSRFTPASAAAAGERLVHRVAAGGVVEHRPQDALDWLLPGRAPAPRWQLRVVFGRYSGYVFS